MKNKLHKQVIKGLLLASFLLTFFFSFGQGGPIDPPVPVATPLADNILYLLLAILAFSGSKIYYYYKKIFDKKQ